MSAPRPAFWNRQLKDAKPLNFFTKEFCNTLSRSKQNFWATNVYPGRFSAIVKVCLVLGGAGWTVNTWKKRRFHTAYEHH